MKRAWVVFLSLALIAGSPKEFSEERKDMIKEQLRSRGIRNESVLKAMLTVPREQFVPKKLQEMAYADSPLPIGEGQTISQPYIVALMTELVDLKPGNKVLEIGTGSGYQAAVLAELQAQVYTIEIIPSLAMSARTNLDKAGYAQVETRLGDGRLGWPEKAPFDAILVAAASDEVPPALIQQLAEGSVLVMPIGPEIGAQQLRLYRKENGKITVQVSVPVAFVPLTGGSKKVE